LSLPLVDGVENTHEKDKDTYTLEELTKIINKLSSKEAKNIFISNKIVAKNILMIADTHIPYTLEGYLEHCKKIEKKYNCDLTVIMGDLIDNHATSYWDTDPDGDSAGEELRKAKSQINKWYEAFPNAFVIYGNHGILPYRKAFSGGMSKHWIKDMKEVLETPNWIYGEEFIINNTIFYHGEVTNPKTKSVSEMINAVGAHNHSQSYIIYSQGRLPNTRVFGMQLGCGVDSNSYAMQYGKHGKAPHINCGVIVEGTPIIEYMDIKNG
jgi:predicted MPP superfamily phosphohydrolase